MEEYILRQQLYILNEDAKEKTTFMSSRGASNIDLTLTNNRMVTHIANWEISDTDSCSDHSAITFDISEQPVRTESVSHFHQGVKYVVKEEQHATFAANILKEVSIQFQARFDLNNKQDMDQELATKVEEETDTEIVAKKCNTALKKSELRYFKKYPANSRTNKNKTVTWWEPELTITRNKVNALRY